MKSLVIPIYRNAETIPDLLVALARLAETVPDVEVVFVVDGSPDDSGELLARARASATFTMQIIFHSRNFGSFVAIRTGLEYARGESIAVMAADLQEPPALLLDFFRVLAADEADIVFGRRTARDDPPASRLLSNVFWSIYRLVIMPELPKGGVDVFACNRKVRDAVLAIEEQNSSLIIQLFWVGFRRRYIDYRRQRRRTGKSGWNLTRRFRYVMDSIFSYTDLPIMVVLLTGALGCAVSVIVGAITLVGRLSGAIAQAGYTTIVLLILFFGSLSLVVQGILGCYIWRTMENSKRRPLRVVSHIIAE